MRFSCSVTHDLHHPGKLDGVESATSKSAAERGGESRRRLTLAGLALASGLCYAAIALLSRRFVYGRDFGERPIIEVLALLALAFGVYLFALRVALRCRPDRRLLWLLAVPAVAFRLTLLASEPIQEIDIYRYLWDGAAGACGVSPFRYSPQQVLAASLEDDRPAELARLVALRDESPVMADILSRVHYGDLPTVYPPVSQAVFTLTALATPSGATLAQRLTIMKAAIVGFDLATLVLVVKLLQLAGRHPGWCLAYSWCPLLLKEFANSGHLDSIAVCLTAAAVYAAGRAFHAPGTRSGAARWCLLASWCLALGVGAKLYPVVLSPLLLVSCWRRLGCRATLISALTFLCTTALVLWPMLPAMPHGNPSPADENNVRRAAEPAFDPADDVPLPPDDAATAQPQDPSLGLKTFLRRWEMNDFLFLVLVENLKPLAAEPSADRPWFAVVPETWRTCWLSLPVERLGLAPREAAFLIARAVTLAVFAGLALFWAARASGAREAADWLRAAFLTLAWFWLLAPTQNPWYWTWALPLLPFARSRAWLAVSGLVMVYYLRFWLAYHWPDAPVPGFRYRGTLLFDFGVTWLEFAPWFGWLLADVLRPGKKGGR